MSDLAKKVIKHKYRERDCSDHYIESCACGANEPQYGRGSDVTSSHDWSWEKHIVEVFHEKKSEPAVIVTCEHGYVASCPIHHKEVS